jgi:hypothetical protein
VTVQKRERFKRLASLHLSKDTLEHRTERLRGDRIEYLAHVGVTGDMLKTVKRCHIALGSFLVTGQARGRCACKQGERRHQRSRAGNVRIVQTVLWDVRKATAHQATERIGGKMLAAPWLHMPIQWSLSIVAGILLISVVASLALSRKSPTATK